MSISESVSAIPEEPNDVPGTVQNKFPFEYIVSANSNGSRAKSDSNAEHGGLDAVVKSHDSMPKHIGPNTSLSSTMNNLVPYFPAPLRGGCVFFYDKNGRVIAALKEQLPNLERINRRFENNHGKTLVPLGDYDNTSVQS